MLWLELAILLACILIGVRLGGIALGAVAGIGLVIFVFVLKLPPGGPPGVVIGMIIAVITALAAMQAAGGLDYLVSIAERVMRRHPGYITFVAPVVTYLLVFASGTTHVIYALLPVIAEVSRKADVRAERPLSISVIAGFQGVLASPISAATVAMTGLLVARGVSLPQLLMVTIPATFVAVLIGALSIAWRGKNPSEDPNCSPADLAEAMTASRTLTGEALFNARGSTLLFLAGIVAVVLIGIFPSLRPVYSVVTDAGIESDQIDMGFAIMIVMFAIAGLIMIFFKASPEATVKGAIMHSGIVAVICIIGISWLGSSFFEANRAQIVAAISSVIFKYPSSFAMGLFLLSSVLFSAAATVAILVPVGLALELPTRYLIAFYPAANSVFFLPTYGSLLAAVSFDRTGSTRIGKYLLNHSFMLPGLVTVISAIVIGLILSAIFPR